jgi:hypothetical protein
MSDRTQIISSPFHSREDARLDERMLQGFLDGVWLVSGLPPTTETLTYEGYVLPVWAKGVRVESSPNGAQHTLVATEHRGH